MATREERRFQRWKEEHAKHKARKEIKRNRKSKRPRQKEWSVDEHDDWHGVHGSAAAMRERVMPRGENERRRSLEDAVLAMRTAKSDEQAGGQVESWDEDTDGLVLAVGSGTCRVEYGGQDMLCSLRGALSATETGFTNIVAVGDRVSVSTDGAGQGVVEAVRPRKTILARPDVFYDHLKQVIVANAEQLLIVASWREPHIWLELVDRFLIAAERYKLDPIVCVNKIDLADDSAAYKRALKPYQSLGYRVLFTSAATGQGVERLRRLLKGRMTALAGLSGVGKSSLLTAVQPDLRLRTGAVSQARQEGRHTTTQVTLLKLDQGGYVVDTPGIREFGLSGVEPVALIGYYPEIEAVAPQCKYADCSHTHEPDCAVKLAVDDGIVSESRYASYCKILASLGGL